MYEITFFSCDPECSPSTRALQPENGRGLPLQKPRLERFSRLRRELILFLSQAIDAGVAFVDLRKRGGKVGLMHRHHFRQVLPAAGGQRITEGLEHEIFDLRQHALGKQIFLHDV